MAGDSRKAGKVLRLPEVEELVGLRKTSISYRMNPKSKYYDPTFPQAVEIGERAVGWLEDEILRWVAARPKRGSKRTTPRKAPTVAGNKGAPGDLPLEGTVHVAQSERTIRLRAQEVLREAARSRKVLSYYEFIERVRERANMSASVADEVLDRIDAAEYKVRKLLPTVVIQERGSPLSRTRLLASTLGIDLSSEQVKAQRQALFMAQLEPSDPRPVGFRWYVFKGSPSMMMPIYERALPAKCAPLTGEEEEQATAMRARYDAMIQKS